ncbi:MAG: hypothetical protein EPN93_14730 [Spirochaetes bacterium]|nr:MAG: hypothetical protein EPN93_14730 [Spirochaetota bacterium]
MSGRKADPSPIPCQEENPLLKKIALIITCFLPLCALATCAEIFSPKPSAGERDSAKTKPAPYSEFIASRNAEYASSALPRSKSDIARARIAEQERLLARFARCPECANTIHGSHRGFMFDAVADCDCAMRVGRNDDGGKWVCNPQALPEHAIVYSFGVGGDISFDTGMAGLFGCQVYMFDPSPSVKARFPEKERSWRCGAGMIHYQPVGIGPVSLEKTRAWDLVIEGARCEVKGLEEIARSLGHTRIDILKMDIEGGEFPVLLALIESGALGKLGVRQVLVEFHIWTQPQFSQFISIMDGLAKGGYFLFRKEFNPADNDGVCGEYAFMSVR